MPRRTRSKKVVVSDSDSEHPFNKTGIDDKSVPRHQVQVVIPYKPTTKILKNKGPLLESSGSDEDSDNSDTKDKDIYQQISSREESEELSESSESSDEYTHKRKLPRRHVTSKQINYSEEKYYKKVHKIFDDFYEVLSSEEESPSTKQKKENNDNSLRSKRRPKRKSAKKSVDYNEKGYYKKFETALNARLY